MRARISLQKTSIGFLPFDYQYALSSALLLKLAEADSALAKETHDSTGYKFYNFSNLMLNSYFSDRNGLQFEDASFIISSPDSRFLRSYAEGLLSSPELHLYNEQFAVRQIDILPDPEFKSPCTMRTISPVFVKTVRESDDGGKTRMVEWDLYPNGGKFYENVHQNLLSRYGEFYGKKPEDDHFEILEISAFKPKRVKIGGGPNASMRRCSLMEFKLSASKELLKFIYDAGIGEKTGMGFGCVEIVCRDENPLREKGAMPDGQK